MAEDNKNNEANVGKGKKNIVFFMKSVLHYI